MSSQIPRRWALLHDQVIHKIIPMSVLLANEELTDLWINDRLAHQASCATARTLIAQIEELTSTSMTAFFPPPAIMLRAVGVGESRVTNTMAQSCSRKPRTGPEGRNFP